MPCPLPLGYNRRKLIQWPMASDDKKPVQGWKAIAAYLGCSVKTAQRWKRKGLPIHRNAVLGVVGYPSELDAWLTALRQADASSHAGDQIDSGQPDPEQEETSKQSATGREPSNQVADKEPPSPSPSTIAKGEPNPVSWLRRCIFIGTGLGLFLALGLAVLAPAYGSAILAFALGAVFVILSQRHTQDTPAVRAFVWVWLLWNDGPDAGV